MKTETNTAEHETSSIRHYLAFMCTIGIGVVVSFILFIMVKNWEQEDQRIKFESVVKGYANAVQSGLNANVEALMFLGDFFDNSSRVTRQEFSSFVKSVMPRYPGIQAFSWNPLVLDNKRADFESLAREEGFENFEFTELTEESKLVRATQRQEYIIVYYIEPLETNKPALGFDIASNPTRLKAINKGFNTAKLSATDRITLVQETGNQFGILLLLPIYRQGVPLKTRGERFKNRKGFVVEVFRINDVIEIALKGFSDEGINFSLYDLSADVEKRFLYNRPSRLSGMTEQPTEEKAIQRGLYWNKTFDFAGRQYKMIFTPSPFYLDSRQLWQAWIVLSSSLFLTFILAFYLFKRLRYTAEIERRVRQEIRTNQQLAGEVSERKLAEEALHHALEKYEKTFQAAPIWVVLSSLEDGRYMEVNEIFLKTMGYKREEVIGKTSLELNTWVDPRDRERIAAQVKEMGGVRIREVQRKTRSGAVLDTLFSAEILRLEDKPVMISVTQEITEQKKTEAEREKLQAQLLQAQKMESVGRLAGGVAHDFNNILMVVSGFSDMALKSLGNNRDHEVRELLEEVQKASKSASLLTRQLLAFSSKQVSSPKIININQLIQERKEILRRVVGDSIVLELGLADELHQILADPAQVEQVLLNLIVNSRDAVASTGTIIIETRNVGPEDDPAETYDLDLPGPHVLLAVTDDGCGIDAETLEHMFEPFFTTKDKGKGTGLGLSTVHGIVRQCGGYIRVESTPGEGTTIRVFFPAIRDAVEEKEKVLSPGSARGSATILLVEDEPDVRNVVSRMLAASGYSVLGANGPREALSLFEQHAESIDLLLTDVIMPEMNGWELAHKLTREHPHIKVIYTSGYPADVLEAGAGPR